MFDINEIKQYDSKSMFLLNATFENVNYVKQNAVEIDNADKFEVGAEYYPGELFKAYPKFHEGKLFMSINKDFSMWYYNEYYSELNKKFLHHSYIAGNCIGVYGLYLGDPGVYYVGMTMNPFHKRWEAHFKQLQSGKHHCKALQGRFNKIKKAVPVIFYWKNNNPSHFDEINNSETKMIQRLWENTYNKRKY